MHVSSEISINSDKKNVWNTITDIENCINVISSINKIEMLHKPVEKLEGLKWKETRTMFGKEATETMWITDSKEYEYYRTRAESHGSIYISKLALSEDQNKTKLVMTFEGNPQTSGAKILSFLMSPMIKKSLIKAISKDLEDIKKHVESNS